MQALRTAGNAKNAMERPKDITFIIDQLVDLNKKEGPLRCPDHAAQRRATAGTGYVVC
jgi:predicted dienelactone hydrolase